MIKIVALVFKDSSPEYHRVIMPVGYMDGANALITNDFKEDIFKDADIVVYNRVINPALMEQLNKYRDKYGFSLCVDIDDYWVLDQNHPMHEEYENAQFTKLQIVQMRNADFITVTHDRLYNAAKYYNIKCYVLPNAIPQEEQFKPFKIPEHERINIFWQGSITHEADIKLLTGAIQKLVGFNAVEMVLAGYMPKEPIWNRIAKMYTANMQLRHCVIQGLHHTCYYQAYKEADICLVPLHNTTFNRMKSNLKVLEAANLGLPVICHKVHPYLKLPVIYANGSLQWYNAIKALANNKQLRHDKGAELKEFCSVNYNFDKINIERKQIFEYYAG